MTITELRKANAEIGRWLEQDKKMIERYHQYAHLFGCGAGANVFRFVLMDAITFRGMTLAQFDHKVRRDARKKL